MAPGTHATRSDLVDLRGQIERVTFTNEENGYTVAKVRVYGRRQAVTVIGNLINPTPGEIIVMQGRWSHHVKYGEQFEIASYHCAIPATVHGIERYLASGLVRGIGPVMAKRIVRLFKEKTLEIIENEIGRLQEVEGIGEKRVEMIRTAWEEQKEIRSVMLFLQSHEISPGFAAKIYKQYGNGAVAVVRENPYRLAADVTGIGFVTADRIAEKLGFPKDSQLRAEAGILYVLHELTDEGHVYFPFDDLIERAVAILSIDTETVARATAIVAAEGKIVIEDLPEHRAVYLALFHLTETSVAARLKALLRQPPALRPVDADKAIAWVQDRLAITLADKQIEAVRCATGCKVMVITGGPGTGKTTIISAVLQIFAAVKAKIVLAAPTGRAAKKLSEATGREAKTIHRLLEYSIQKGGFQKNEEEPLGCQLIVVDEASMIDTVLMHHLLKAIPPGAIFILVGDVNQLPSVGAGNVLKDIIEAGVIPVVELTEIFRQARRSSIVVNAHRINEGHMPYTGRPTEGLDDFYFIEQEDPEKVLEIIIRLVKERIPARFGLDPVEGIQVITPMHRGVVGAGNLNVEIQKVLNPGGDGILRGGRAFRLNDKVMQVKNNYLKEVFNGDMGRIIRWDDEEQEAVLSFDGRQVVYDYRDLDEIVLAYAVSVHKSQGSEYPAVVMPILAQHYVLLQRNLLYTAVTRGRKLVVIVGTKRALGMAVRNNRTEKRCTALGRRLAAE